MEEFEDEKSFQNAIIAALLRAFVDGCAGCVRIYAGHNGIGGG